MRIKQNLLIYPKVQLTLILINIIAVLFVVFVMIYQSSRASHYLLELGVGAGLTENHPYFQFVQLQQRTYIQYLFAGSAVAIILSTIFTLAISHRLVGPVVRLKNYFLQLNDVENLKPISFRKNDYFSDLAFAINKGLEKIKGPK